MDWLLYKRTLMNRVESFNLKEKQLRGNMIGIYMTMRMHIKMIVDCFLPSKLQIKS